MSFTTVHRRSAFIAAQFLTYDFLAPSVIHLSKSPKNIRCLSTSQKAPAVSSTLPSSANNTSQTSQTSNGTTSKPKMPLTPAQIDFLTRALRVNQAGELAATLIYKAQTPPLLTTHPHLRPLMKHMHDQEAGHFATFNHLLATHRVRPTLMYPIWTVAATALGWSTGLMGREAAMACTEAVETEIGGHYNGQVRTLLDMASEMEERGEEVSKEFRELTETIRRIRDEELEHLDHAVEHDAKEAKPYELLTGIIRAGCRGAIWVSERV